jgi:hypothetical protein
MHRSLMWGASYKEGRGSRGGPPATRQTYWEQLQKLLDTQESTPLKIEEYLPGPDGDLCS